MHLVRSSRPPADREQSLLRLTHDALGQEVDVATQLAVVFDQSRQRVRQSFERIRFAQTGPQVFLGSQHHLHDPRVTQCHHIVQPWLPVQPTTHPVHCCSVHGDLAGSSPAQSVQHAHGVVGQALHVMLLVGCVVRAEPSKAVVPEPLQSHSLLVHHLDLRLRLGHDALVLVLLHLLLMPPSHTLLVRHIARPGQLHLVCQLLFQTFQHFVPLLVHNAIVEHLNSRPQRLAVACRQLHLLIHRRNLSVEHRQLLLRTVPVSQRFRSSVGQQCLQLLRRLDRRICRQVASQGATHFCGAALRRRLLQGFDRLLRVLQLLRQLLHTILKLLHPRLAHLDCMRDDVYNLPFEGICQPGRCMVLPTAQHESTVELLMLDHVEDGVRRQREGLDQGRLVSIA
mmetsp:Transcript_28647/g.92999  ORF Transcript_28647/g.92999 Transcript_28647/m.92999 type:complete len:397 (-) Transcript_28647:872-2062(-)